MANIKKCTKCNMVFEIEDFWKDSSTKDGKARWCKSCFKKHRKVNKKNHAKYNKKYRKNNREYFNEYSKKHREENKDWYHEYHKRYRDEMHDGYIIDSLRHQYINAKNCTPELIIAKRNLLKSKRLKRQPLLKDSSSVDRSIEIFKQEVDNLVAEILKKEK